MKRVILSFVFLILISCTLSAQVMRIIQKDGTEYQYNAKEIDYIDFEPALEYKDPETIFTALWNYMVAYQTSHDTFGYMSIVHATDMMCEDIAMAGFHWFGYDYDFDNRLGDSRRTNANWSFFYRVIELSNYIIKRYPESSKKNEMIYLGQALAIRAFSLLYLVQLYQFPTAADGSVNGAAPGVPIILTTSDRKSNNETYTKAEIESLKGRNTVADVFAHIESDLIRAITLLEESGYKRYDKQTIDDQVAYGILARFYLLAGKWQEAANAAAKARKGYEFAAANCLDGFVSVFNPEWMWGFNHDTETQTTFASFFSQISSLAPGYCGLGYNTNLIDARLYSLIPNDDVRKQQFNSPEGNPYASTTGAQYPYANIKFGHVVDWSEDYMYMRAPEMVLIEAEAYCRMGNTAKAAEVMYDLMDSRQPSWRGLHPTVDLEEILLQRRIELWGEGFGYFDLKRNNKGIDRNYAGSNHREGFKHAVPARDPRWIYQIPQSVIKENDHISESDQNP